METFTQYKIAVYDSDGDSICTFDKKDDLDYYKGPFFAKHFMITNCRVKGFGVQYSKEGSSKEFKARFVKENWHHIIYPDRCPVKITGVHDFTTEDYVIMFQYWWALTGRAQAVQYYHDVHFLVEE